MTNAERLQKLVNDYNALATHRKRLVFELQQTDKELLKLEGKLELLNEQQRENTADETIGEIIEPPKTESSDVSEP